MSAPKRSERVTVRFRPHQLAAIEDAAEDRLVAVSEFIRAAALDAARKVRRGDEEGAPDVW